MAVSAETQAIIDRLKAEGDLIRNSGTNSIRSVKIQLDRFEGIFNTISANVVEQTKILQMQAGIAAQAVEEQRTKDQLDEIKNEQARTVAREESDAGNRAKTDANIESMGNAIKDALSLKNIALGSAGLFVGYNFLKGFINDRTDGGFDRMINSIATIEWENLADAINRMAAAALRFETWLDDLPMILLGGGIAGAGMRGFGRGLADTIFDRGGRNGPTRGRGGMFNSLRSMRTGLSMAVLGLSLAYGDEIHSWLTNPDNLNMPDNWADTTVTGIQVASGLLTVARIFGIGLASPIGIAAAAIGVAYVLGRHVYNWFKEQQRIAEIEMQQRLSDLNNIYEFEGGAEAPSTEIVGDVGTVSPGIRAQQALALAQQAGTVTPDMLAAAREGDTAVAEQIRDAMRDAVAEKTAQMVGTWDTDVAQAIANIDPLSLEDESGEVASLIARMAGIKELGDREGSGSFPQVTYNNFLDQIRRSFGGYNRDELLEGGADPSAIALWDWLEGQTPFQFRGGTKGFRDFGSGTFSVLHGREAVVPYNTAAGRFLDQYFTENWQPKFASAENLAKVAAAASGGGTVIISAPTTVAPTVNNVSGGKSINQLSVSGGGGMGGIQTNPYGIPGAAN